jgi:glycosyltransferase involved in cell wall biosynthesis
MTRRLNILIIAACPLPWPRGTPIRVHRMAEALHDMGHGVHVATYPVGDPSVPVHYAIDRVAPLRAAIDTAPGPSLRKLVQLDPLLTIRARHLLASRRFDVIHAHHYEGLIAALLARLGRPRTPVVFDAHTLLGSELPQYELGLPRGLVGAVGRSLDRYLPRRADHIIAVSERMQEWFLHQSRAQRESVSLIPNGVEHEHFVVNDAPPPGRNTPPTVMFAGNLAEYQSLQLLFEAFRSVRQSVPDARLVLATDGDMDQLASSIKTLGLSDSVSRVSGNYVDLPRHLASADVLANPRVNCDGIPQKVLNYMAAGRGIASFQSSAGPLEHERTGLVVPDGDTAGFASAMLRLLREPAMANALGEAARREVVAQHGWHQVAARVTALYEGLLGKAT